MRLWILAIFLLLGLGLLAQPKADFSVSPINGCSPLVVKFKNNSTGAVKYEWDLGNGNKSTLKDPSAIYYVPGFYTVKLTATDASGSTDVKTVTNVRVFKNPIAKFSSPKQTVCEGESLQLKNTSAEGDTTIALFSWDLGDGNLAKGSTPSHQYAQKGVYTISLYVQDLNGCTSDTIQKNFFTVKERPVADYDVDNKDFCSKPALVRFTNKSSKLTPHTYAWDFGDGNTSNNQHPSHTYTNFGTFKHRLTVTASNGCTATFESPNSAKVAPLIADFEVVEELCGPATFTFKNTTNPQLAGMTYRWDFGAGKISALKDPKQFLTSGTYTVKLSAYLGSCFDDVSKSIVVKPKPTATMSIKPTVLCKVPIELELKVSPSNYNNYKWSVNGESVGNGANIKHQYKTDKIAYIQVDVVDGQCITTLKDTLVYSGADISVLPDTSGCAPLPVKFKTNIDANASIASYSWDFGDGNTSSDQNPNHTYQDTGSFLAVLTVTDVNGCKHIATTTIEAGMKIKPNLSYDTSAVCNGEIISLTNLTKEVPVKPHSYIWEIGENTSSEKNPNQKIRQRPGIKQVKLITEFYNCRDTFVHPDKFRVKAPYAALQVLVDSCGPADAIFKNTSIEETSFIWLNYPVDGLKTDTIHKRLATGYYQVGIAAYNATTGCRDTVYEEFKIWGKPLLNVDTSGNLNCPPISLSLDISVKHADSLFVEANGVTDIYWTTFDTFVRTTIDGLPSNFDLKILATNYAGCRDSFEQSFSGNGPKALGSLVYSGKCLPYDLDLYDSTYGLDAFDHYWKIGNSSPVKVTSASMKLKLEEKIYGKNSVNVRLMVGKGKCQDFQDFAVPVESFDATMSMVSDVSCNKIAYGVSVKVEPDTMKGLSYEWGLNDKWYTPSKNNNTTFLVDMDGTTDTAKVRVQRTNGCTSMFTKLLKKPPARLDARFSADTTGSPCPPLYVSFKDESFTQSNPIVSWEWDLGDGSKSTKEDPGKMYLIPGNYSVALTVKDNKGCVSTTTYPDFVTIDGPKAQKLVSPLSGCVPLAVDFFASSDESVTYQWDLGDGNVVTDSALNHIYDQPGTYIPLLTVADSFGCSYTMPPTDTIRVNSYPFASFTTIGNCAEDTVIFAFDGFHNGNKIKGIYWDFDDGVKDTGAIVKHVYRSGGVKTPSMVVMSEKGCKDSIAKSLKIYGALPSFSLGAKGLCYNDSIEITHTSTADTTIESFFWSFADSIFATSTSSFYLKPGKPGVFPFTIFIRTINGCQFKFIDSTAIRVSDTLSLLPAIIKRTSVLDDFSIDLKIDNNDDLLLAGHQVWLRSGNGAFKRSLKFPKDDTLASINGLNTLDQPYCMMVAREGFCESVVPKDTSLMHCTVELKAIGDTLKNKLNWTPYVGWDKVKTYEIYARIEEEGNFSYLAEVPGNQTNYVDAGFSCKISKRYKIHAIEDGGFLENSWSDTAKATPRWGYEVPGPEIWRTSVEDDAYTIVEWRNPKNYEVPIKLVELYKGTLKGNWALWDTYDPSVLADEDKKVQVDDRSYLYRIRAMDTCKSWSPYSNKGQTVLLSVGFDDIKNQPKLTWSKYGDWHEGVDHYLIERLQEDNSFETIGRSINNLDTFFTDDVVVEKCNPNYCYRVTAIRNQPENYPDSSHFVISHSNVDCAGVRSSLFAPNAFTMNDDNLNETFQPVGMYLKYYRLRIFNRWGEKLWETDQCLGNWDGYYMGKPCHQGTYMYTLFGIGSDNVVHELSGTIHLLK
jgi:gliding motility-associated-like protein